MSGTKFGFCCLAVLLTVMASSCNRAPDAAANDTATRATVPLRILTASGPTRTFTVEVAVTPEEQQRGLMHRTVLPAGHGMTFPSALPRIASFWMKDTLIPLDLLFVRPDGTIAAVLHGKPEDLTPISAGEPVSAVVEIAGGSARALGIAAGDHVQWGQCPATAPRADQAWNALAFCPPMR